MKKWIRAARLFAVGGSYLPAILGALLAYNKTGSLDIFLMVLTAIGASALHVGANFINDYFDYITGSDDVNTEGIYPFSGGSKVIQEGIIPARHILWAAITCFTTALGIGIYLFTVAGPWVLIFGFTGLISCILYVSPKLSLTNLGLGEFSVGFNLGLLLVMGSYYVQTSTLTLSSFMVSLPISITTTLILLVNEFPDYKGDALAGKRNVVVRLGRKKASVLLSFLLCLILILLVINAVLGFMSLWSLVSLLALPFFLCGSILVSKYNDDVPNYIPAIITVISVNTFVNLYLIAACFAFNGNWPIFYVLTVLVLLYEIKTFKTLGFRKIYTLITASTVKDKSIPM